MIHLKVGLMLIFKDSNILMLEYEFVKQIYMCLMYVIVKRIF